MRIDMAGLCLSDEAGLHFTHNPWLVALSYGVAVVGSYVALDMGERLRSARGRLVLVWNVGSAATLGGSIWSMHFIGMLAMSTMVPVTYDPWGTALSLAIAIGACLLGVRIASRNGWGRLLLAGCVVGLGVAAMHYTGMAAIRLPGRMSYTPTLWGLSVVIAIAAATAAFWLSRTLDTMAQRAAAALVMAGAICGMHYVGMASTVVHIDGGLEAFQGLESRTLSLAVAGITITLLMLALVCDMTHRRLSAAADRETGMLLATNREIVRRLCTAGEFRDDDTGQHVKRLALLAARLARQIGCDDEFVQLLLEAAPLHDIGKIGIPDRIMLKPGKLTDEEWLVMRSHSEIGSRILSGSGMKLLDLAAEIALTHHEKWDGSGYPRGLAGEAIPLAGRIVAVADVFDALLSSRPYKEAWSLIRVENFLQVEAGRHFEPRLVSAFLDDLDAMVAIRRACSDSAQPASAGRYVLPEPMHSVPQPQPIDRGGRLIAA